MPRQPSTALENSFAKGLITSSSGLNFPENAVTSASNCVFDYLGTASRREGFDFEVGNAPKTTNYQSQSISSYLWHNVTGDNTTNIYVVQIGGKLYFYPVTITGSAISPQIGAALPLDFSGFSSQAVNAFNIDRLRGSIISGSSTGFPVANASAAFDGITTSVASQSANDLIIAGTPNTATAGQVFRTYVGKDFGSVASGSNPGPQKIGTATITAPSDLPLGYTNLTYQNSQRTISYTYQFVSQTATLTVQLVSPQNFVGWQVVGNTTAALGSVTSMTFIGSQPSGRGSVYNYSLQLLMSNPAAFSQTEAVTFFLGSTTFVSTATSYAAGTITTTLNQTADTTAVTSATAAIGAIVQVNLRGSNTAPTSANDASSAVLGTASGPGTISPSVSPVNFQNIAYRYVWFEVATIAATFSGNLPANTDTGAITTGGSYTNHTVGEVIFRVTQTFSGVSIAEETAIAEIQFYNPATSIGSPFVNNYECQFATGLGYLFVTHPWCYPFVVGYTPSTNPTGVYAGTITSGGSGFTTGVFSNITMTGGSGNGAKCTITCAGGVVTVIGITTAGNGYAIGDTLGLTGVGAGINFAFTITGLVPPTYTANPIVIQTRDFDGVDDGLQLATGSSFNITGRVNAGFTVGGTATSPNPLYNSARYDQLHLYNLQNQGWGTDKLATWSGTTGFSTLPSNCDVWWHLVNSSNVFTPTNINIVDVGSSAAPKGSFIFDAFYIDRGAVAGSVSGVTLGAGILGITHSNLNRPSTVAFFAGRAWYSGVNYPNFSNCIWFSQILSPTSSTVVASLGQCYQTNDPTSSKLFDLLPTDGGTIRIPDCGTIIKLFPMQGALLVFATNGIWVISGSKGGLGFTANDYSINRLSTMNCLSGQSIVDVQGQPMFWTNEGIYTIRTNLQAGGMQIQSLTYTTIDSFYKSIPRNSKVYARGAYNPFDFSVQWLYRSTAPTTLPDDNYKFDSVLVFNTITGGFSPYTISTGNVNVASIVCVETGLETDVTPSNTTYTFKYFVTYKDTSGNLRVNIADMFSTRYLDWYSYDNTGQNYTSTFTSGYKFIGQGVRRGIPDYIYFYVKNSPVPNSYKVQSIRDYGIDKTSGRWSSINLFTNSSTHYSNFIRRHRLRGRGLVMQYKVTSYLNDPFDILGWAVWTTAGTSP